jgi:hypothetical protein
MTHDALKKLVMKASDYINEGIPLKDVMSEDEVAQAINVLADIYYVTGTPHYNGEDE